MIYFLGRLWQNAYLSGGYHTNGRLKMFLIHDIRRAPIHLIRHRSLGGILTTLVEAFGIILRGKDDIRTNLLLMISRITTPSPNPPVLRRSCAGDSLHFYHQGEVVAAEQGQKWQNARYLLVLTPKSKQ